MIPHTEAFRRLKAEAQKVFDFAIVITYAVPALKFALKDLAAEDQIPFKPEHFESRPIATAKVRANAREYKAYLSRYIFLSAFSFFEAYFHDVLREVIAFHGKQELLQKVSISHNLSLTDQADVTQKRKLQEYQKRSDSNKYRKAGRHLAERGYKFPSSLLAAYGLQQLVELVEGDYFPAAKIPELAERILQLTLDKKTEIDVFQAYREQRNRIAHGRPDAESLHLRKAVEANNFLRNLALKVDQHVVHHFLVVEPVLTGV